MAKRRPDGTFVGRKPVRMPDGSLATQVLITVTHPSINNGLPTNIPSLYGKEIVSEYDAIFNAWAAKDEQGRPTDPQTGRVLKPYETIEQAIQAARKESDSIRPRDFNRALEKKLGKDTR